MNRYFNPPADVGGIGRRLLPGDFVDLCSQLNPHELLIGVYLNQVLALVATELATQTRFLEMERLWAPAQGYYAVPRQHAEVGFAHGLGAEQKAPADQPRE